MPDESNSPTLGSASSGQDGGQAEPSGGDTDSGVSDHGQGTGDDGGNPSKQTPAPDKSITDDDGSALIEALSSGEMDTVGDDGEVKPKDDAKEEISKEEPPKAEGSETDPEKAKEEPAKTLSDEDQAEITKAPKAYRKELTKLFEERHTLRTEVEKIKGEAESLKPVKVFTDQLIKHATEAGLVENRDGSINTQGLHDLIEQERMLRNKSPKEIAEYYRGLADDVYPDGRPVTLPQDLKDLVDMGSLPEDDALAIARKREAKTHAPEHDRRQREARAAQEAEQVQAKQVQAAKAAQQTGFSEITQVSKEYQTRFGAEWATIGKQVEAELGPLLKDTAPTGWKALAKTVIESVVARRRPAVAVKKPNTSPVPNPAPTRKAGEAMSEEEERNLLAAGKL